MSGNRTGGRMAVYIEGHAESLVEAAGDGEQALGRLQAKAEEVNTSLGKTGTGFASYSSVTKKSTGTTEEHTKANEKHSKSVDLVGSSLRSAAVAGGEFAAAYAGYEGLKGAVEYTEELAHETEILSQATGLGTKEASQFIELGKQWGVSNSQVGMTFKTLSKQITEAEQGSTSAKKAFHDLGVPLDELRSMKPEQVLERVSDAFQKLPDGAEKTALNTQLFGRSSLSLLPILDEGSKGLKDQLDKFEGLSAGQIKSAKTAMEAQRTVSRVYDELRVKATFALVSAGQATVGWVKNVAAGKGAVGEFAKGAIADFKDVEQWTVTAFQNSKKVVESAIGSLVTFYDESKVVQLWVKGMGVELKLWADVVKTELTIAFEVARKTVTRAFAGIKETFEGFVEAIKGVVEVVSGILTGNWGRAWEGVKHIFGGGLKEVIGVFKTYTAPLKSEAEAVGKVIGRAFELAWEGVEDVFEDGINGVIGLINDMIGLIDKLPFVDIGKIGELGASGKRVNEGRSGTTALGGSRHESREGGYATGGFVQKPMFMVGEEAPQHPEWVIATNPAYRQNNLAYWARAGHDLGVPGFALGGLTNAIGGAVSGAAGSVEGAVRGAAGDALGSVLGALPDPSESLPHWLGGFGEYLKGKLVAWVKGEAPKASAKPSPSAGKHAYRGKHGSVILDAGVNMSVGEEPTILADLKALSGEMGETVYVISGYRSPRHSVEVGGFADDPHTRGEAADIGLGSPTLASMAGVSEKQLKAVGLWRPFASNPAEINHVELIGHYAKGGHVGWLHEADKPWFKGTGQQDKTEPQSIQNIRSGVRKLASSLWPIARRFFPRAPASMPSMIQPGPGNGLWGSLVDVSHWGKGESEPLVSIPTWLGQSLLGHPEAALVKGGYKAFAENGAKQTLIHEWAHTQQVKKPGEWPFWAQEGGAQSFARYAAPHIYAAAGIPFHNPGEKGAEYTGFADHFEKVFGTRFVRAGQFIGGHGKFPAKYATGGLIRGYKTGGRVTASSIKSSGVLSPEEWMFAMLLGGFPAKPGVLAQGTGTIKSESDFNASVQTPGNEHEGGWELSDAFGPTSMKLSPIASSHAAFLEWKKDGGFWQAWGQWEQEQSGLSGGGAHAYGPEYLSLAKQVVRKWNGAKGTSSAGGANVKAASKPAIGAATSTGLTTSLAGATVASLGGLLAGTVSGAASGLPGQFKESLREPGLTFAQKVGVANEALTYAEETGTSGAAASTYGAELENKNISRLEGALKKKSAELKKAGQTEAQRKRLKAERDHLRESLATAKAELASFEAAGKGEEGEAPEAPSATEFAEVELAKAELAGDQPGVKAAEEKLLGIAEGNLKSAEAANDPGEELALLAEIKQLREALEASNQIQKEREEFEKQRLEADQKLAKLAEEQGPAFLAQFAAWMDGAIGGPLQTRDRLAVPGMAAAYQ